MKHTNYNRIKKVVDGIHIGSKLISKKILIALLFDSSTGLVSDTTPFHWLNRLNFTCCIVFLHPATTLIYFFNGFPLFFTTCYTPFALEPRYFIGFNRCAYGNDLEYVTRSGNRIIRGPDTFVFDEKCLYAFYYHDKYRTWLPYISVNGTKDPTKIFCHPAPKHNKKQTKLMAKSFEYFDTPFNSTSSLSGAM